MAGLAHSSTRTVLQQPTVVHDRLLELAARLQAEAPSIEPGSQEASLLGVSGPVEVEIADRGARRIELWSTRGRIRVTAAADIDPAADGRTTLTIGVDVEPHGFGAGTMLNAALSARPSLRHDVVDGLERAMTDLATELAKPDGEWDASAWQPPGLTG